MECFSSIPSVLRYFSVISPLRSPVKFSPQDVVPLGAGATS
jgi:hypothetical protein